MRFRASMPGLLAIAFLTGCRETPAAKGPEAPEGMVWVPGGTFAMGTDSPEMADARPWHMVTVSGFWMDRTEVTNAEFAKFVNATAYLTVAERTPLRSSARSRSSSRPTRPCSARTGN